MSATVWDQGFFRRRTTEVPAGHFDPGAFGAFLAEQSDLGTTWAPQLVRTTSSLPLTATHKISKPILRRLLWRAEDPVYEHTADGYVVLSADRKAAPGSPNMRRTAGIICCGCDCDRGYADAGTAAVRAADSRPRELIDSFRYACRRCPSTVLIVTKSA
jgi:hypothetical protein